MRNIDSTSAMKMLFARSSIPKTTLSVFAVHDVKLALPGIKLTISLRLNIRFITILRILLTSCAATVKKSKNSSPSLLMQALYTDLVSEILINVSKSNFYLKSASDGQL